MIGCFVVAITATDIAMCAIDIIRTRAFYDVVKQKEVGNQKIPTGKTMESKHELVGGNTY